MEIKEFYTTENKEHWLAQIKSSDWGAGQFLYTLLSENRLKELCGESTKVYLLTDDQNIEEKCEAFFFNGLAHTINQQTCRIGITYGQQSEYQ